MNEANQCPLLSEEHLCRIQSAVGEELLSHTCATYPRIVHELGGVREMALTLSCPEAARLVLLTPDLPVTGAAPQQNHGGRSGAGIGAEGAPALPSDFWAIRAAVLKLLRMRTYPLWQRLFLLHLFCGRLDSIAQGSAETTLPAFLAEFDARVATAALRPAMENLPSDRSAQLDIVLRLAGLMLHKSNVRPRFVECVRAFTAGIGNGPGATLESLAATYAKAHDRCYAPFFDLHPHIMENFLVNTVVRCQFPFGKESMRTGVEPDRSREFALLAAQFVLMRGFLIGVAGHHGAAFSSAHVVHTVQAASKHFEHHPEFLNMAHALLKESNMDGARGLAILLRDATMDRSAGEARPAAQAILGLTPQDGRSAVSKSAPEPGPARPGKARRQ
jgi:lysine-N-methylase